MISIKKLKFPSENNPGADLRLSLEFKDTQYTFFCNNCNAKVSTILDHFIEYGYDWKNIFSEDLKKEISDKFKYGGTFCLVKCSSFSFEYILQIKYYETSNNAFRAEILDIGLIEK